MSAADTGLLGPNLAAMKARAPELAEKVASATALPFVVSGTRSGAPSATLAGAWLHSRYDPTAEATRVVGEALASGAEFLIVLGLGLGYAAKAGVAAGSRVTVVESDPASLRASLEAVDLSDLLSDPRCSFILCPGGEGLDGYLAIEAPRTIAAVENAALMSAAPDAAAALRSQIAAYRRKGAINSATLERFGRLWARNLIRNLDTAARLPGVGSFAGAFDGLPAVVLAAGPSLDEALAQLALIRRRCVVVAVDTALRSSLKAGIEPDFVVVVDPQYWNARHLDSCRVRSSVLVTEAAVWPSVLRFESRATVLCSSIYPLGRYVEDRLGVLRGALGAGGSVATTAWDFARSLGCSPVFMAGLDLSFPGGRTHAKASLFEQRSLNAGKRTRPASSSGYDAMLGGNPFVVPANDGSKVVSDERLAFYASWFSARLSARQSPPTYNLSSQGMAIDGMPYAPVSELFSLPERRLEIDAALRARGGGSSDTSPPPAAVDLVVSDLIGELTRIVGFAQSASFIALKAIGNTGAELSHALNELAEADRNVLESPARDVVGFFFSSSEKIVGARAKTVDDSLRATHRLYEAVSESARWHIDRLSERLRGA